MLVNNTDGRRDFNIYSPTLCCHPCSAFFFSVCVCCTEKGKVREGKGGKEEWSAGAREQRQGGKWVVALTLRRATMEPFRLIYSTLLTVGSLSVSCLCVFPVACMPLQFQLSCCQRGVCEFVCLSKLSAHIHWCCTGVRAKSRGADTFT